MARVADPPSIVFGPSARTDTWWALLPSAEVLSAHQVSGLLDEVERAMARDDPGRPFTLVLDLRGAREPGVGPHSPTHDSAAYRAALRRLPDAMKQP
jgi:hypothetical protein